MKGKDRMNNFYNTNVNFYRHSGKAPVLGLILIGIAGLVVTPILGVIYGYLLFYIPIIYLNLLVVFGYVYAVSYVLSRAAKFGKVRNNYLMGIAGFGFGLLAEYVGWVSWIAAIIGSPVNLIGFFYPREVLAIIMKIAQQGAWSFEGTTPTGIFLYLIWVTEALFVVGGITYMAVKALLKLPFCEESDAWADKRSIVGVFEPITNSKQFKASISQGSFSAFNELKPSQSNNHFTLLELYECDVCKNFFVLNVNDVVVTINNRGRRSSKTKSIVSNLIVTPITLASLRKLNQEQQPSST